MGTSFQKLSLFFILLTFFLFQGSPTFAKPKNDSLNKNDSTLYSHIFDVNSEGNEADSQLGDGFCKTDKGTCSLKAALDEISTLQKNNKTKGPILIRVLVKKINLTKNIDYQEPSLAQFGWRYKNINLTIRGYDRDDDNNSYFYDSKKPYLLLPTGKTFIHLDQSSFRLENLKIEIGTQKSFSSNALDLFSAKNCKSFHLEKIKASHGHNSIGFFRLLKITNNQKQTCELNVRHSTFEYFGSVGHDQPLNEYGSVFSIDGIRSVLIENSQFTDIDYIQGTSSEEFYPSLIKIQKTPYIKIKNNSFKWIGGITLIIDDFDQLDVEADFMFQSEGIFFSNGNTLNVRNSSFGDSSNDTRRSDKDQARAILSIQNIKNIHIQKSTLRSNYSYKNNSPKKNETSNIDYANIFVSNFELLKITESQFFHNKIVDKNGGAITLKNGQKFIVNQSLFIGNEAKQSYSLSQVESFNDRKKETITKANLSNKFGGALFAEDVDQIEISKSEFTSNLANNKGGAVFLKNFKKAAFHKVKFDQNMSFNHGGALAAINGDELIIDTSQFNLNKAISLNSNKQNNGGALFIKNITQLSLTKNQWVQNNTISRSSIASYDTSKIKMVENKFIIDPKNQENLFLFSCNADSILTSDPKKLKTCHQDQNRVENNSIQSK